jgi:hypothetical protein
LKAPGSEIPTTDCREGPDLSGTTIVNSISHISRKPRLRGPRSINTRMTTKHEMEIAYAAQQEVIAVLYEIGEPVLADRLKRCMTARQERHYGDGWPFSCRTSGCYWCRRAMVRGWWEGMRYWSAAAKTSSLAIIPIRSPAGLADAARRLRRGLRDVRDRTARRYKRWRTVSYAGMIGGDHAAMVMISHDGVDRRDVLDVLRRRWPDVVLKGLELEEPAWTMTPDEAADLGGRRRGVEPLRILVMPQKITRMTVAAAPVIEAMPVLT